MAVENLTDEWEDYGEEEISRTKQFFDWKQQEETDNSRMDVSK